MCILLLARSCTVHTSTEHNVIEITKIYFVCPNSEYVLWFWVWINFILQVIWMSILYTTLTCTKKQSNKQ